MDETSLEIVYAGEMYPKLAFVSDDGDVDVPFNLLSGENPLFRGRSSEGLLLITNYRIYHSENNMINIPLALIDYIECREMFYIYIYCKDGQTFRCTFDNVEESQKWTKRFQNCTKLPEKMDDCFAFRFLSYTREEQKDGFVAHTPCNIGNLHRNGTSVLDSMMAEVERMGFDLKKVWKVSHMNESFELCPSYPQYLVAPALVSNDELKDATRHRYSQRLPAVVWRHQRNGCVIARCSQPRMGIWGSRNKNDEKLIAAISTACSIDSGCNDQGDEYLQEIESSSFSMEDEEPTQKKLLIIDARSYTAAMTNRAKGGGYEYYSYYPNCEVQFMGLANIHAIRSSFSCLRMLCSQPDDQNWLSTLENSKWLYYIAGLLRAALVVVDAVDVDERPVLVHCSDGWDRTPQIVALAELMLDPYYRTKKGFQVLVEREWLNFGHKFADRCGHPDGTDDYNERSPVFLQWLDCVYQLLEQFKCHFEFNEQYLVRLVLHTYSCLFGTFLCNTEESRKRQHRVPLRTFSVWPILNEKSQFHNYLYNHGTEVLRPSFQMRNIKFWSQVYLPTSSMSTAKPTIPSPSVEDTKSCVEKINLVKTKSCDNLHNSEHSESLQRRKSDPSIVENPALYPEIPNLKDNSILITASVKCDQFSNPNSTDENVKRTDISNISDASTSKAIVCEPTMLGSTDTLVNENGALLHDSDKYKIANVSSISNCSVATDTYDLTGTLDYPLQQWTIQNSKYADSTGLPVLCQNALAKCDLGRHKSCASGSICSCATSHCSRTPSSGFPATPCDDLPTSSHLQPLEASGPVMEFDGLPISDDFVQNRIKKIVFHYKNQIENLKSELATVQSEFLQHLCRQYRGKDFLEDVQADLAVNGEVPGDSPADSESSWDMIWPSTDQVAVSTGV